MISIVSIYNDVRDDASPGENGSLSFDQFNRRAERANLWLIDFLTGGVTGLKPPVPYFTQKNKDFLQSLIKAEYPGIIDGGTMAKPEDYYTFEHLYMVGSSDDKLGCEGDNGITGKNTPIELMDSQQYDARINTFIDSRRPSIKNPISKLVGDTFYFFPKQLGQVNLEYIRYPKTPKLVTKRDTVYNKLVPDETLSVNFDWPEFARELIIWFIVDGYSTFTREGALKQAEQLKKQDITQ